ncbi:hypothetical protein [Vibrio fluvialis]|uniref:hypothetical protein n=1 Tax=Vibrio fluvialis TaxID=676 RepID=UPI0023A9CD40|nr:hypothetical protein [Vibrio fluvialis]MDE5179110.1 hypothetical protein [Vibrio fluvialis]
MENKVFWEKVSRSRALTALVAYLPCQVVTLAIGFAIHMLIPSSLWCEVADTSSSYVTTTQRWNCGVEQLLIVVYLAIAVSVLVGVYAFLFPKKAVRAMQKL